MDGRVLKLLVSGSVALGACGLAWAQSPKPVSVKATDVTETRVSLAKGKKKPMFAPESELKVTLHVEGDEVKGASSYGKLRIETATDSAGTDLKPKEERSFFGGSDDDFTSLTDDMARMRMGMSDDDKKDKPLEAFDIELKLGVSARKATTIATLKGSFQVLAGGQEKVVTAKKLSTLTGKALDDPALKDAGLTITVADPKKAKASIFGSDPNSITLQIKGDLKNLADVEILDAKGESVSNSTMSTGEEDNKTYTYGLEQPPDDTLQLRIKVLVGQKTVNVPFELKDVPLP